MSMVFAAEVARRIRSKDTAHSLWRYLPLIQKANDDEQRFINWNEHGVRFSPYIHDVSESTRTMRKFIFDLPFAKMRYTEMRLLGSLHPLCGMQHDYPALRFVAEPSKKAFMAALVERDVPDDAGDAAGRQMLHAQYILPLKDGEFLRETFPTLRGKLLLVQALWNEEMGIGFANSSPQILALLPTVQLLSTEQLRRRWLAGNGMAHQQDFPRQHAYKTRRVLLENTVSYGVLSRRGQEVSRREEESGSQLRPGQANAQDCAAGTSSNHEHSPRLRARQRDRPAYLVSPG
jgi:hypothetical protein